MMIVINDLLRNAGKTVSVQGWVANKRSSKNIYFLVLRDGTGFCQGVIEKNSVSESDFETAARITMESSCLVTGVAVKDEKQIGGVEIRISAIQLISQAEEYPISKKEHGVDFLMDNRHLWIRSQRQWAILKIRNTIVYAIHRFFQERGFIQTDSPLFTGNAVEGTSTLFETDFYGQPAYLSQSGQLYGEAMAMAMGRIYTFGPTFRAEKSKTRRHLSEFWMIEPEMAFYDLPMNMDLIEEMLQFLLRSVLLENQNEFKLIDRDTGILEKSANEKFPRLTYDEAVLILTGKQDVNGRNSIATLESDLSQVVQRTEEVIAEIAQREEKINSGGLSKGETNFNQSKIDKLKSEWKELEEAARNIPQWIQSARSFAYGDDFGGSDESVITRLFDVPVLIYNWPHEVKAFYLKRDETNNKLARGVDCLAPEGYGEIVGGGERETNLDLLKEKITEHRLPMQSFEWYLDLRRYGSVPHSGFGLGLERLITWICKLPHVRESIPFPRMYGRLFP